MATWWGFVPNIRRQIRAQHGKHFPLWMLWDAQWIDWRQQLCNYLKRGAKIPIPIKQWRQLRPRPWDKEWQWERYREQVYYLSELEPLHTLPNIEKRGANFNLDHVLSIRTGFLLGLPEETVAHISNLRIIPRKENMVKGNKIVYTNLFNEDGATATLNPR